MALDPKKKQELLELLGDPEVLSQLKDGQQADLKRKDLLKPIEVDEDMSISDVVKAYESKLSGLVEYFDGRMQETKAAAVDEAMAPANKKEEQKVIDFVQAHPLISENKDLEAAITKLYGAGFDIEDGYNMAMTKLGIEDPASKEPSGEEETPKAEEKKEPKKEEAPKTTSFKTTNSPAEDDEGAKEGEAPRTMREIIQANVNKVNAEMNEGEQND